VDAFLYIGSGMFHPGAYLREIEKPLFVANPYSCEVSCHLSEEYARWRGRQKARVLRCLDAHLFGVLVSTKTGQFDMEKAYVVKDMLEGSGRSVLFLPGLSFPLTVFSATGWMHGLIRRVRG